MGCYRRYCTCVIVENQKHSRRRLIIEIEMMPRGSTQDSATTSLVDPTSDLFVLAMCETESTLRSFLPVFGEQRSAHDPNNGVGVRAQQDVSQFMCHHVTETS